MKTQFLDGIASTTLSNPTDEYINHNGMILRRINGLNGEEYYQALNGEFWQKVGGFFKKIGNGVVNVVSNLTSAKQTAMQQTQSKTTPPTSANTGLTTAQIVAMQNANQKQGLPTGAIIGIAAGGVVVVGILIAVLNNK